MQSAVVKRFITQNRNAGEIRYFCIIDYCTMFINGIYILREYFMRRVNIKIIQHNTFRSKRIFIQYDVPFTVLLYRFIGKNRPVGAVRICPVNAIFGTVCGIQYTHSVLELIMAVEFLIEVFRTDNRKVKIRAALLTLARKVH